MKAFKKRHRDSLEEETGKEEHKKNEMPNFLLKLYQILETNDYNNIIEWGENGKYFVVKNLNEFTDKVLPKFFKHNNFSSFVRQLNMYDFHKKRNSTNENIFQHKNFIRGQKNLIKTIKRKNNHKDSMNNNPNEPEEEVGLVEYCTKELSSKKMSKLGLEKVLGYLVKTLNETNEKQKRLESKVEELGKQNEEFIIQNQQMLQEIVNKSDYTKKLETLLFFIIEVLLPKHHFKNSEAKNLLNQGISSNLNGLVIPSSNNEFKTKAINDGNFSGLSSGLRNNFTKGTIDSLSEGYLKTFFEKFIDYNNSTKRDKYDFLPMLTSSKEEDIMNINDPDTNINLNTKPNPNPGLNLDNSISNLSLTPKYAKSPLRSIELPKMEIEDQNEQNGNLFNSSPNPFFDDMNFSHSNIFNSPKYNSPGENFPFFSRQDTNKPKENESNIISSLNNFRPATRNSSIDLSDLYKNPNANDDEDYRKKMIENNYAFDDSYFSVSSEKNKSHKTEEN